MRSLHNVITTTFSFTRQRQHKKKTFRPQDWCNKAGTTFRRPQQAHDDPWNNAGRQGGGGKQSFHCVVAAPAAPASSRHVMAKEKERKV